NRHLTFDAPLSNYTPQQFPMNGTRDIIAPFWADLDNRDNGNIYYVQNTSGSLVQQVTQDINRYFPGLNFQANWIFIATWHEVAYYPKSGTQTTLQAVLTTNGHYSFVLMNYGSIASTSKSGGYDTISSSHHFTIPGSFSTNATGPNSTFRLGSNVNVPGQWAFRVDHGSIDCNFSGKNTNSRSDDGSSPAISLPRTFSYFGQSYSQIYHFPFYLFMGIFDHSSRSSFVSSHSDVGQEGLALCLHSSSSLGEPKRCPIGLRSGL
uniref:NIDO domain-containing protein n=1 Tax=Xiphophorus couchianus TaxID=32473 RepID=A0A3B5KSF1_9TELE